MRHGRVLAAHRLGVVAQLLQRDGLFLILYRLQHQTDAIDPQGLRHIGTGGGLLAPPVSGGEADRQGQASGELMQAPAVLMLEVCQSQFLACASLFVDQPELGEDPHWQASAFALFWSAIAGGPHDA